MFPDDSILLDEHKDQLMALFEATIEPAIDKIRN
jgi:hypothetical protein